MRSQEVLFPFHSFTSSLPLLPPCACMCVWLCNLCEALQLGAALGSQVRRTVLWQCSEGVAGGAQRTVCGSSGCD